MVSTPGQSLGTSFVARGRGDCARQAKFSPTYLQGKPVTVTGQLLYNFVIQ